MIRDLGMEAMDKIRSEMTQNAANSYIQVVVSFLLQHLELDRQDAEKILAADVVEKVPEAVQKELEELQGKDQGYTASIEKLSQGL